MVKGHLAYGLHRKSLASFLFLCQSNITVSLTNLFVFQAVFVAAGVYVFSCCFC